MPRLYLFFLLLGLSGSAFAQVVRGKVTGEDGAIPFASVRVKNTTAGTMANAEGRYEIKLQKGTYTLEFQSLGYRTEERRVDVEGETTLDVALPPQALQLQEAVVGNTEDPAQSIMRRAIAKAPIERMKVRAYTAMAYIKGGGRLVDAPWFLESKLKSEGIDEKTVFFTESVSELTYRAPSFYKNRAISIRSNMEKLGGLPGPNSYINNSFYQPMVLNAVSPLSPRAFSYYRFSYEGIFQDRGVEVNKIRVRPRQGGDDVFDGYIYIIEGQWCLHSLNLKARHEGITIETSQLYTPIENVWMPATQKYKFAGSILGFEFEGNYVASLRDYKLTVDPKLVVPVEVIDEKKNPEEAKVLKKSERKSDADELGKILADSGKMTRKSLRKLAKALRKQERKEERERNKGEDIVIQDSTVVDSMAYKRDSTYWAATRTVPLTQMEVTSTVKLDSLAVVKKIEAKRDSIKDARNKGLGSNTGNFVSDFLNDLSFGKTWFLARRDTGKNAKPRWNARNRIKYSGIFNADAGYNTVEGYVLTGSLRYQYYRPAAKDVTFREFQIGPKLRYEFARTNLMPSLDALYYFPSGNVKLELGRTVSQINPAGAISPMLNTAASLLFERNYMRLFEKDFVRVDMENYFADRFQINSYAELAERRPLTNHVKRPLIDWKKRQFWPNIDDNYYAGSTAMDTNRSALLGTHLTFTPTVRYVLRNGRKSFVPGSEPYIHVKLNMGLPGIARSKTDFLNAALGLEQTLELGIRAKLIYYAEAGAFLYHRQTYVPDYFHFDGNRTFLIVGDGLRAFRNLPYYRYSTPVRYAQQHAVYTMRRFLITRIPIVEILGWKESLGYHGLTVPGRPQYSELTYGIDGIFRFLRIEGVATFEDVKFKQAAFRIGITLKGYTPKLRRSTGKGSESGEGIRISL